MLASVVFVIVAWLLLELVLWGIHYYRYRYATAVPRRQEDRILISCTGLAFGMVVACLWWI